MSKYGKVNRFDKIRSKLAIKIQFFKCKAMLEKF